MSLFRRLSWLDWLYLLASLSGVVGFLFSPWPWLAGLWFAGCLFVAVRGLQ